MHLGCLVVLIIFFFFFLVPFFFAQVMLGALSRLGMSPEIALLVLAGMLFGGAINIPLRRFQREKEVVYDPMQIFGLDRLRMQLGENWPFPFRKKAQTSRVFRGRIC